MLRKNALKYAAVLVALLILWQLLSMALKLSFLPPPAKVIVNLFIRFLPEISVHAVYSLWRVFAGIGLSMLFGIPLGLGMGYFPRLDKFLSPVVYFTYPVPKIALLPLVMLIFGLGEFSKILMLTMIIVFHIIVAMRDAALGIPKETFYTLVSLGAGTVKIIKKIVIPASLPGLFTSLRVSLGTALSVLFFTETFGTQHGMGYYIMDAWMRVDYTDMFTGILVLSIIGLLLFILLDVAESTLCRWKTGG